MNIDSFKEIISTFADPATEMLFDGADILFSVNGQEISAKITTSFGDVSIDEGAGPMLASVWIVKRLANLTMLAQRIKELVPTTKNFVPPCANILQSLENKPDETPSETSNALNSTLHVINSVSPLESTVLYITSDAGEGKTTLINELAVEQASRFISNEADWLLVPIPLGGRHFLRFDDITVGVLQNRYRFPFLYYNSFIALVRMGIIVPAFDGFEEMFVESSSGEALSAMGILVGELNSVGTVLIAARKAYFEFENLKSQEKLYDTINKYAVGFGKIELKRWGEREFLAYCHKRNVSSPEKIYDVVCERLGKDHSLLTRPVLVKRLVDIAITSLSLTLFLDKVNLSGADFFSVFVQGIIEREAGEKWLDRSGEIGLMLLTVDEHVELLAQVAVAMWDARVDYLKRDLLEFVSDYFCEIKKKSAHQSQQIRERLRGHALLVSSENVQNAVEFDHDEFRLFFLGEAIASTLKSLSIHSKTEALGYLRKGVLPEHSLLALLRAIKRDKTVDRLAVVKTLIEIASLDGQSSYTHENCGALILRLLSDLNGNNLEVDGVSFSVNAFRDIKLMSVEFDNCYISQNSLENTSISNCIFKGCEFGQLNIFRNTKFTDVSFYECEVDSIKIAETGVEIWEPTSIKNTLRSLGVNIDDEEVFLPDSTSAVDDWDEQLLCVRKLLRYFMRSTHVSESVISMKLGDRAKNFISNTIPELINEGALAEIENRGGTTQRRFRLSLPLATLNNAISTSNGSFEVFLNKCKNK